MKVRVGQIFRLSFQAGSGGSAEPRAPSFLDLTRGRHSTAVNPNHGIWDYPEVDEPGTGTRRIPAIVLHSNPFTRDAERNPWLDVIEPDEGYALYNGDNKSADMQPFEPRGNRALWKAAPLYMDPSKRVLAPPIILFRQALVAGRAAGNREFCGYGVPTKFGLRTQKETRGGGGYFTNLVVEVALFNLTACEEELDWEWIDDRRDPTVSSREALRHAPPAWRRWVQGGERVIEECRRRVVRDLVISRDVQLALQQSEARILRDVHTFYSTRRTAFEGLAARATDGVIGAGCRRRWVTRASRDGGFDFVCLLPLGEPQSRTGVVVLGQAKCIAPASSIGPEELARLVARLRRGWIGAFVTTGTFSAQAQEELLADNYPLVLVNGMGLAREVRRMMQADGLALNDLLEAEGEWYAANVRSLHPSRAMEELNFGLQLAFPRAVGDRPRATEDQGGQPPLARRADNSHGPSAVGG